MAAVAGEAAEERAELIEPRPRARRYRPVLEEELAAELEALERLAVEGRQRLAKGVGRGEALIGPRPRRREGRGEREEREGAAPGGQLNPPPGAT
jgi:hypothetical protein